MKEGHGVQLTPRLCANKRTSHMRGIMYNGKQSLREAGGPGKGKMQQFLVRGMGAQNIQGPKPTHQNSVIHHFAKKVEGSMGSLGSWWSQSHSQHTKARRQRVTWCHDKRQQQQRPCRFSPVCGKWHEC